MTRFTLNGKGVSVDVDPATPLALGFAGFFGDDWD